MADILYNYVKFMRGNLTDYKTLASKDADTLYFVYEEDQSVGQLYIGERLITNSINEEGLVDYLSELKDVDITGVSDKNYLGYDANSQKWIPMELPQAIQTSIMSGASATIAGKEGLVPAPAAGDQNKFLRGDGTWQVIEEVNNETVIEIQNDIIELKEAIGVPANQETGTSASGIYSELDEKANVKDIYTKSQIDELISGINALERKKVNSIDEIDPLAPDADQYIYIVPSGDNEGNKYEEYIVIDGSLEKIGSIGTSPGEYNVINAVNEEEFSISTDGTRTLSLKIVPAGKLSGLENNETFKLLQTEVGTLSNNYSTMNERLTGIEETVNSLKVNSSWGTIGE